jgi:multicomponent Na+:H+ antiporter subunit D
MPVTSACFVLGALALAGFPPLNGFWSKLTIYLALARAGLWWAAVLAVLTSILTMVVMVRAAVRVFWGNRVSAAAVRDVPARMWAPMAVLAAICVLLGTFPQAPYRLLDRAASVLATLGR